MLGNTVVVTPVQASRAIVDEAHDAAGTVRPHYRSVLASLEDRDLPAVHERVRGALLGEGCTFGEGDDCDAFPIDVVPRLIPADEWAQLAAGLEQRVRALDAFLVDVYRGRRIVDEGIIPARVLAEAEYFEPELTRLPPQPVLVALAGLDVIRCPDGRYRVLEDNLRTPSGLAYAFSARRAVATAVGDEDAVPVEGPAIDILARALRGGLPDARLAVLTDGPDNAAYWEHARLAELLDVPLVTLDELDTSQVDVVYRRTNDDCLRGPDGAYTAVGGALIDALREGRLHCVNALGNGAADDKLLHAYVEDMIRFYLGEEPRIESVPSFDLCREEDREQVLDRLDEMVIKPRAAYGGVGVFVGPHALPEDRERVAREIVERPADFIAQETVFFSTHPTLVGDRLEPRHIDLRAFVAYDGTRADAIPGGLSRFATGEGELVVNSSQGGGGKDTRVLRSEP